MRDALREQLKQTLEMDADQERDNTRFVTDLSRNDVIVVGKRGNETAGNHNDNVFITTSL